MGPHTSADSTSCNSPIEVTSYVQEYEVFRRKPSPCTDTLRVLGWLAFLSVLLHLSVPLVGCEYDIGTQLGMTQDLEEYLHEPSYPSPPRKHSRDTARELAWELAQQVADDLEARGVTLGNAEIYKMFPTLLPPIQFLGLDPYEFESAFSNYVRSKLERGTGSEVKSERQRVDELIQLVDSLGDQSDASVDLATIGDTLEAHDEGLSRSEIDKSKLLRDRQSHRDRTELYSHLITTKDDNKSASGVGDVLKLVGDGNEPDVLFRTVDDNTDVWGDEGEDESLQTYDSQWEPPSPAQPRAFAPGKILHKRRDDAVKRKNPSGKDLLEHTIQFDEKEDIQEISRENLESEDGTEEGRDDAATLDGQQVSLKLHRIAEPGFSKSVELTLNHTRPYSRPNARPSGKVYLHPMVAAAFDAQATGAVALLKHFDGDVKYMSKVFAISVVETIPWQIRVYYDISADDIELHSVKDCDVTILFHRTHRLHRPDPTAGLPLQCGNRKTTVQNEGRTGGRLWRSYVRIDWNFIDYKNKGKSVMEDLVNAFNADLRKQDSSTFMSRTKFGLMVKQSLGYITHTAVAAYAVSGVIMSHCRDSPSQRPAQHPSVPPYHRPAPPKPHSATPMPHNPKPQKPPVIQLKPSRPLRPPPIPTKPNVIPFKPPAPPLWPAPARPAPAPPRPKPAPYPARPAPRPPRPPYQPHTKLFPSAQSSVPQSPTKSHYFSPGCIFEGVDFFGYDIKKEETGAIKSAAECAELCRHEPDCYYWTYNRQRSWCYLKSSMALLGKYQDNSMTANLISGTKDCEVIDRYPSAPCYVPNLEIRTCQDGYRVTVQQCSSALDCHRLCTLDDSCHYWTFDARHLTCILKGGNVVDSNEQYNQPSTVGLISGAKRCAPQRDTPSRMRRLMEADPSDKTSNEDYECGFGEFDLVMEEEKVLAKSRALRPSECRAHCVEQAIAAYVNSRGSNESKSKIQEECVFWRFDKRSGDCVLFGQHAWKNWTPSTGGNVLIGTYRCRTFSVDYPPVSPLDLCYQEHVEFAAESPQLLLSSIPGVVGDSQCDLLCATQLKCTSWTFRKDSFSNDPVCNLFREHAHKNKRLLPSYLSENVVQKTSGTSQSFTDNLKAAAVSSVFGGRRCRNATANVFGLSKQIDSKAQLASSTSENLRETSATDFDQAFSNAGQNAGASKQSLYDMVGMAVSRDSETRPSREIHISKISSSETPDTTAKATHTGGPPEASQESNNLQAPHASAKEPVDSEGITNSSIHRLVNSRQFELNDYPSHSNEESYTQTSRSFEKLQDTQFGDNLLQSAITTNAGNSTSHMPPCARAGVEYIGHDLLPRTSAPTVSSALDCFILCADTTLCFFWTYDSHRGSCFLKDVNAPLHMLQARPPSYISGLKFCPVVASWPTILSWTPPSSALTASQMVPTTHTSSTSQTQNADIQLLKADSLPAARLSQLDKATPTTRLPQPDIWNTLSERAWDTTTRLASWLPSLSTAFKQSNKFGNSTFLGKGSDNALEKKTPSTNSPKEHESMEQHGHDRQEKTRVSAYQGFIGKNNASQKRAPIHGMEKPVGQLETEGRDENESGQPNGELSERKSNTIEPLDSPGLAGVSVNAKNVINVRHPILCHEEVGVSLNGGDLLIITPNNSEGTQSVVAPKQCAKFCADTPACFYWTLDESTTTCYLKSSDAIKFYTKDESSKNCVSGPARANSDCTLNVVNSSSW